MTSLVVAISVLWGLGNGFGFGIHVLMLQLVLYVVYPVAFFMGVSRHETPRIPELFTTKPGENEVIAYLDLETIIKSDNLLSGRALAITIAL